MSKKYSKVYVVINEGEVVYASTDFDEAEAYADTSNINGTANVLSENGNDDPTPEDYMEAAFQAGYDGEYYEVQEVDITDLTEDDEVELDDGTEIDVSDILQYL